MLRRMNIIKKGIATKTFYKDSHNYNVVEQTANTHLLLSALANSKSTGPVFFLSFQKFVLNAYSHQLVIFIFQKYAMISLKK